MNYSVVFKDVYEQAASRSPVILGLGIVVLTLAGLITYRLLFHPLAKVPGPLLARTTDYWKMIHAIRGDYATALEGLHQKYGRTVRIGPNDVSIIDPDAVKLLYGHKSEFLKGPFYNGWGLKNDENHFSDRDPVTHAARRRRIANTYSMNTLLDLEASCDECSERFLRLLDRASAQGTSFDLADWVLYYSIDVVGEIAFGESFGLLDEGKDETGVVENLGSANKMLGAVSVLNGWGWLMSTHFFNYLFNLMGDKGPGLITKRSNKLVDKRLKMQKDDPEAFKARKDMMYRFITSRTSDGKSLDYSDYCRESQVLVVAGADTTATSIRAFVQYVWSDPPTLKRLQEEVDEAYSSGQISLPISYADAKKLVFHQACMKEAMRMHPAVQMPMQRVVPAGGREIAGRYYPAGTYVGVSPREIHRDEQAYGPDAKEWRPQRWIDGDRNELEAYNLVFGAGSRVCLGKNISLMEMSKLLPALTLLYDFKFKNPEKPFKVFESWFAVQYDGLATVSRRADSPAAA